MFSIVEYTGNLIDKENTYNHAGIIFDIIVSTFHFVYTKCPEEQFA